MAGGGSALSLALCDDSGDGFKRTGAGGHGSLCSAHVPTFTGVASGSQTGKSGGVYSVSMASRCAVPCHVIPCADS